MNIITCFLITLFVLATATTGTGNRQQLSSSSSESSEWNQSASHFHLIKIRPKTLTQTNELTSTKNRYGDDKLIFLQDLKPKKSNQVLARADILETFKSVLRSNNIWYRNKGESRVKSIQLWREEEQQLRNTTNINMLQENPMGMAGCMSIYAGGIQYVCTRNCKAVTTEDARWCFSGAIPTCGEQDPDGEYRNCMSKQTCSGSCARANSPENCVDSC